MNGTQTRQGLRQAFDVPFADCWISPEAIDAATRVLVSGWVTTGREVEAFEDELAAYVGARHAVAVSSCTAAIELSLRSLRLPPGSRVLTSSMTFCGAVQAILHAGLQPVLVDVDPETSMPTIQTTMAAARAGGRPAAMVVVHFAGNPADVPGLAAAAGLPRDRVVEDAAHALGASGTEGTVGAGAAACFSFYATKNLPVGEGGMVTTDDPDRAAWLRRARLHGMSADAWRRYLPGGDWRYDVEEAGLKANLTDLQAAIGRAQLNRFGGWQRRRAELAHLYDAGLARVPGLALPHRPSPGRGRHAWHLYAVRVLPGGPVTRDQLMVRLRHRGIGTSVHFRPIHHLTHFATAAERPAGGLSGAEELADQTVSLPLHPRLRNEQVQAVCAAITDELTGAVSR